MTTKLFTLIIALLLPGNLFQPWLEVNAWQAAKSGEASSQLLGVTGANKQISNKVEAQAPNLLVADNPVRRAEFTPDGFRYQPKVRSGLRPEFGFHYRLKTIGAGKERPLADVDRECQPTSEGHEVFYRRPLGITEKYQALDSGVEQLFILERDLNLSGSELLITGELTTNLRAEKSILRTQSGITFYSGEEPVLHYGAARVIDAAKRELLAELRLEGNQLSIAVDGDWLSKAEYPVTVDPWVGPSAFAIPTGPGNQLRPAIAYANPIGALGSRFLVVWEQTVSGATQIYGRFLADDGATPLCTSSSFSISGAPPAGDNYRKPAVAYKAGTGQFLVVWEHATGAGVHIMARCVGAPGDCDALGTAFDLTLLGGASEICPDVAADPFIAGRFLVVYLSTSEDGPGVYGQWVYANCNWCPSAFLIRRTADMRARSCPAVAYGEPVEADFFTVVYRSSTGALQGTKVMRPPSSSCNWILAGPLVIDPFVATGIVPGAIVNDVRPDIAYNTFCNQWLVSWADMAGGQPVILAHLVNLPFTMLIPPSPGVPPDPLTILPAEDDFGIAALRTISVAGATTSGGHFAITFDGGPVAGLGAGGGFNVYARTVTCLRTTSTIWQEPSTASGAPDWRPAIAFNSVTNQYFVVWQHNFPFLFFPGSDIYGRMYLP
jgi:hypothetical protein